MAPRTRSKLDLIVEPKFQFCCKCFRACVINASSGPLRIRCQRDAEASVLCKQFAHRGATCEVFTAGLLGDCYDFSAILDASDDFWTGEDVEGHK
ncbi:hypothetical protein PHISCL_03650 [Aspergillus sclerotialis]|uniref:Uncharacterized protein n=1 Tax=Aspergillus sclerotialis TaxID=2070753 RepID=A0A3A3A1H2_9EURO|nr:hypothetical protein PHISCL_03650 [Aspergillus sclerotialis]